MRQLGDASQPACRARMLLRADADSPERWTDREFAKACRGQIVTVEHGRRRCVLEGLLPRVGRPQPAIPPGPKSLAGEKEAQGLG